MIQLLQEFTRFGQQIYVVGPVLQEMLSRTSLKNVDVGTLRAPLASIYVATPDSRWQIWGGVVTQWHQVAGLYLSLATVYLPQDEKKLATLRKLGVAPTVRMGPSDTEVRCLTYYVWGAENRHSRGPGDDASFRVTIQLDTSADLEQQLLERLEKGPSDAGVVGNLANQLEGLTDCSKNHQMLQEVNRFGVNLLMYLCGQNREITGAQLLHQSKLDNLDRQMGVARSRKRLERVKALQKQKEATSRVVVSYVAPSIERRYAGQLNSIREVVRSSQGHAWRPGYWNWYWLGAKKAEDGSPRMGERRVHRWVEPYEINKDVASTVERRIRRVREPHRTGDGPITGDAKCEIRTAAWIENGSVGS